MSLQYLSDNLVLMLENIIKNQKLSKLLYYTNKNPLEQVDITNTSKLIFENVFPFPYDPIVEESECAKIHVYYPRLTLKSDAVIEETVVFFDIIVAKTLWTMSDGNKKAIRPYLMAQELVNTFGTTSIETLGRLNFQDFRHLQVNDKFDCLQLVAKLTTFNHGK